MTQITSNRLGISQPGSQWLGNSGCHGKRLHSVEDRAAPRCGSWPRNSIEVCTKSGRSEGRTLWNGFVSSFPRFACLHVPCFSCLIVHAGSCEYWCACQKVSVLSRSALAKVRQINQKPKPSYVHRPWVQSTGKHTLTCYEELETLVMYHHTWAFTFPVKLREVCYGRCFSIAAVLLAVLFSGHRQLDGLGPSAENNDDMEVMRK